MEAYYKPARISESWCIPSTQVLTQYQLLEYMEGKDIIKELKPQIQNLIFIHSHEQFFTIFVNAQNRNPPLISSYPTHPHLQTTIQEEWRISLDFSAQRKFKLEDINDH